MKDDTLDLQNQLKTALEESSRLRAENNRLKSLLNLQGEKEVPIFPPTSFNTLTNEEKIVLFRSLFRGREDVYALRWEGKEGKKGYSPAYTHDRNCPSCFDDWKKRSRCENRKFLTITDEAIRDHLSGKQTVGIYPLLTDETCWFLAIDFDGDAWMMMFAPSSRRVAMRPFRSSSSARARATARTYGSSSTSPCRQGWRGSWDPPC